MNEVKIGRFNFYADSLVDDDYIHEVCSRRLSEYEDTLHEVDALPVYLSLSLLDWKILSIKDVEVVDFEGNKCISRYYSIQVYYSEVFA